MSKHTEYEIEYTIKCYVTDDDVFSIVDDGEEIGFGVSGTWDSLNECAHALSSQISNGWWETVGSMPDPDQVMADIHAGVRDMHTL